MKNKIILTLTLLFSFVLPVYADTSYNSTLTQYYEGFDRFVTDMQSNTSDIDIILDYYNENYSEDYPYFILFMSTHQPGLHPYSLYCFESSFDFNLVYNTISSSQAGSDEFRISFSFPAGSPRIYYNYDTLTTSVSTIYNNNSTLYSGPYYTDRNAIISSNMNLTINSFPGNSEPLNVTLNFPTFQPANSNDYFQNFSITTGNNYPTYNSIFDGSYTPSVFYTEVNLNDYAYIALSLKNYSATESFDTIFMVQGQLCLTPVYDYGMKEKTEFYTGYQIDRCSPVYDTFTPNRISILQQDIDNHAIYYLKAYDLNITNKVKIDTNIFDISYISSENANKPSVTIDGRSYPTIPYDNLSSSATISEEEGYISGESKNVFDISSDSNFIENLFANPLQALGNVWTSIISMFALVGTFIGLLPNTLQVFLITGFSLGIILGVLKILF